MTRENKLDLINHLSYKWFIYLLTAIVILFSWYLAFNSYYGVKADEKVSIYIGSSFVKINELKSILEANVDDERLRQVNVNYDNNSDDDFYLKLNTRGLVNTDIVILPKSVVDDLNPLYLFAALDKELLIYYFDVDNYTYLYQNGICLGLVIKNDNISLLSEYITFYDEEYYLFINKNSHNLGELGNKDSDLALKVISHLIKME